MGYWTKHKDDVYIPDWLKKELPDKCPHCDSDMMNYYNDDIRCTNRKCSNENCYGFVAAKADFARKILKIEGIGYARCLKDATMYKCMSPFELFKVWGLKPILSLDQFLRIHCFEGIDSDWEKIVKSLNLYTLDELFEKYDGKWKQLLIENKDKLYSNLSYVRLIERPSNVSTKGPRLTVTIMITGTPNGFETKDTFINTLNEICKGKIVILHQKTKRQSGVDFLIREQGSTTRGKVEAAIRGGIPIVTSEQFIKWLTVKMIEINSEQ